MAFDSAATNRAFDRLAFIDYFEQIIAENLGDRSHLAISDATIFPRVMEVIWTGASHREVSDAECPEQEIIDRHKEWCESIALPIFLFHYPALVAKLHRS